jgi:hypothetical protein
MIRTVVKMFKANETDFAYPCLLQHNQANNFIGDIILAISGDAEFLYGVVVTNCNQLKHLVIGETVDRYLLKKDYRIFYGEVVLSNG